jgi:hypothetical protein
MNYLTCTLIIGLAATAVMGGRRLSFRGALGFVFRAWKIPPCLHCQDATGGG